MMKSIFTDNLLSLFNFGFNTTKCDRNRKKSVETEKYQIIFFKYFTNMMKLFRLILFAKYFLCIFVQAYFHVYLNRIFLVVHHS